MESVPSFLSFICSYAFNKYIIKEFLFIMFSVYNISIICKENKPDVCHVLVIDI